MKIDPMSLARLPGLLPHAVLLVGDEAFLKRRTLKFIEQSTGGEGVRRIEGGSAPWVDIADELLTPDLFGGGKRLLYLENAEDFVTKFRSQVEAYLARPNQTGCLILDLASCASNTKVYKLANEHAWYVSCTDPSPAQTNEWLRRQASDEFRVSLDRDTADALIDLAGPELGALEQELTKLATFAGEGGKITRELVSDLVGGWKTKTAWELIDRALEGKTTEALRQLDRLLLSGENPIGLLAQLSSTLRKLGVAARIVELAEAAKRRVNLRQALEEAGCKPFALGKSEQQLRRMGRDRATSLLATLLELDLALKGGSQLEPRLLLERLIVEISSGPAVAK